MRPGKADGNKGTTTIAIVQETAEEEDEDSRC